MRVFRTLFLVLLLMTGTTLVGQTDASDFYVNMLRRGVADVEAGRYEDAVRQLRIAAFGLLESIQHYQTAQIHLAVAASRLGRESDARLAAQRVVAAERVEARYGSLQLPAGVKEAFRTLAANLLAPEQVALLQQSPANRAAPQTATTVPQPPPPPPQTSVAPPEDAVATTPAPVPPPAPIDPGARLTRAEAALSRNALPEARAILREVIALPSLDRTTLLRIAEDSYRARDFANAIRAFERLGSLGAGEEPYRYYLAVALYETGDYKAAKSELMAALPFIEATEDVARYRARIEGARD